MDDHEYTRRIEILPVSDAGRRRRWTDVEKLRIVAESHRDGANLSEVAHRHEISRAQLYEWRYRHKLGLFHGPSPFVRVVCAAEEAIPAERSVRGPEVVPHSQLTVDVGGQYRVQIPSDFDMSAAALLLNSLKVER
jgi:transposase